MLVVVLPLSALVLCALLLRSSAQAAPPGIGQSGATGVWPPFHENLSQSGERASNSADIEAEGDTIVVAWAEGRTTSQLNNGVVMLAWKRGANDDWHTQVVGESYEQTGFAHYQPAVALDGGTQTAHVIWVREDTEGASKDRKWVRYAQCDLVSGACTGHAFVSRSVGQIEPLVAPDIAVDGHGVPHAVWAQENAARIKYITYNNRVGGGWHTPQRISGNSADDSQLDPAFSQDNPAVAADAGRVYVVWDENFAQTLYGYAGIYSRVRDNVTSPPSSDPSTHWEPDLDPPPLGMQLSETDPSGLPTSAPHVDGYPAISVGDGWAYVMWERFVVSKTVAFYGVYTYTLPYRVLTDPAQPETGWWPGGYTASEWATMPYTVASAADTGDYYPGVRPSLHMVGKEPHVVWHQWYPPGSVRSAGEELAATAGVAPSGELTNEYLVSESAPYRVSYATYQAGTDPSNLEAAKTRWVSETVRFYGSDHVLSWPDVALASTDGGTTQSLHVAVHYRQAYKDGSYGWDVCYANDGSFHQNYLPVLSRNR
jgi:hypothetical protein